MDIRSSKLLCTTEGIEIVVYVGLYGAPHLTHDFANPNLVQELVNFCEQRSGSSCSTRSTVETPTSIARRLLITTNLENVFLGSFGAFPGIFEVEARSMAVTLGCVKSGIQVVFRVPAFKSSFETRLMSNFPS